ncbi:MAG: sensor histidine kinase [Planctomycetota bacterium]|nr:sensor histidine kinase [Planctomycetota bacterium]
MRRPWQIWGTFFGCLALVAVAVGWLSLRAWEADRAEFTARELAALEENVRLALWRMDSIVAPFIAQESVRPPAAFQVARRPLPNAEAVPQQAPSPLRGQPPPVQLAGVVSPFEQSLAGQFIQLYFQLNCDGRVTSPQVWYSDLVNEPGGTGSSSSDHEQGVLLDTLRTWIDLAELESQLPPLDAQGLSAPPGTAISPERGGRSLSNADGSNVTLQIEQAVQQSRSVNEFQARRSAMAKKGNPAANNRAIEPPSTGGDYEFSPFRPIVTRGELLLARRARIGAEEFIQGCWLDWKSLEQELEQTVADLLPGSRLELQAAGSADPSRTMASLPIVLIVPVPEPRTGQDNSPVRFSLVLAWGAMSLAALAVAALLGGVVTLSERRASFVSAVTHELRTPLTTFRMYSEMLADGMVTEPAQQTHYLRTLRVEADRLTHLVENVLAYARLERGGLGNRMAATPAARVSAMAACSPVTPSRET